MCSYISIYRTQAQTYKRIIYDTATRKKLTKSIFIYFVPEPQRNDYFSRHMQH